jgi:hypothetical protein
MTVQPVVDIFALSDLCTPYCMHVVATLRIAAKMEAGRTEIGESVADEAPRGISIEMVLLGGKHRSLSEFQVIAGEAGVEIIKAEQQPSGYFVTECRPRG